MAERFEHRPMNSVYVAIPNIIYIGMADRAEFDKIDAPACDNGENEQGHVITKTVGDMRKTAVIFQFWVKSLTVDAILADGEARRKAEAERAP